MPAFTLLRRYYGVRARPPPRSSGFMSWFLDDGKATVPANFLMESAPWHVVFEMRATTSRLSASCFNKYFEELPVCPLAILCYKWITWTHPAILLNVCVLMLKVSTSCVWFNLRSYDVSGRWRHLLRDAVKCFVVVNMAISDWSSRYDWFTLIDWMPIVEWQFLL